MIAINMCKLFSLFGYLALIRFFRSNMIPLDPNIFYNTVSGFLLIGFGILLYFFSVKKVRLKIVKIDWLYLLAAFVIITPVFPLAFDVRLTKLAQAYFYQPLIVFPIVSGVSLAKGIWGKSN